MLEIEKVTGAASAGFPMFKVTAIPLARWSVTALLMSQAQLVGGCEGPSGAESGRSSRPERELRRWIGYTSEEYPPLVCPDLYAVRGVDCTGKYCDNISLSCEYIGRGTEEHTWLPYFSEEGNDATDEGHCTGASMWMTGLACHGKYCDNISLRCSRLRGTSTGSCVWSDWYSDEQPPFRAPLGRFIKGMECDSSYCDDKRYQYCWMY